LKEYKKRSVNGNAGEYLAAYQFTKVLQWPYRMLDIDIGVDGEIEILDSAGISTSDVIKVQVKTFNSISKASSKKIYVKGNHIQYWKKFCLPIIVVCVDLSKEKVYWKPVTATECYENGGKSQAIIIDLQADELTPACGAKLQALVSPATSKEIGQILNNMRALYATIKGQNDFAVDAEQLYHVEGLVNQFEDEAKLFNELALHFPWRCGILTRGEVAMMQKNVRRVENNVSVSYSRGLNGM